jgi:hypothetical protein
MGITLRERLFRRLKSFAKFEANLRYRASSPQ